MDREMRAGDDAGFFRHSLALVSAFVTYIKARLHLAGVESKEAALHYAILVALAIGALVVIVFGYLFLCLGLIFLIAAAFGGGNAWIWVTFAMALLHFGGAGACLWIAKARFGERMFAVTMDEFKKDQEWLRTQAAKPL